MVSVFSVAIYENEKESNYLQTESKLDTVISTLSIWNGGFESEYIKNLALTTDTYIGVFDATRGKFIISDTKVISMDIFLGLKEVSPKIETDIIDNNKVMYKAKNVILNEHEYIIVVASNLDIIYIESRKLFTKLLAISLFLLFLNYFVLKRFNKTLEKEIKKIQCFLSKMAVKDYSAEISPSKIKEFNTIGTKLTIMKNSILALDEKSHKRAAKIRLKNTQLESILSSISHEFKNPIAIIKIASQTLKSDPDISEEDKHKFIDKITKNSDKMVNLIDKIKLTFSQNKELINKTKFSLNALSKDISLELMEKYKDRNIFIGGECVECEIEADKDLIRQVIQNLVENALKYSHDDVFIEINKNSFCVIDRGIGISPENLSLVTKRYFRVSGNSWNSSLGLGLYIVRQILKAHDFKLIIESELDKGSKFGFEF